MSTENQEAEARKRVSFARIQMFQEVPFFGYLALKMEVRVDSRVPLAATNIRKHLVVNPDWALSTSMGELVTTIMHEVLHLAMGYYPRMGHRTLVVQSANGGPKMHLWNLAHDYAINLIIEDMVKDVPKLVGPRAWNPPGLVDDRFRDMSAEEIYDLLASEVKPAPSGQGGQPGQSGQPDGPHIPGLTFTEGQADMEEGSEGKGSANPTPDQIRQSDLEWKVNMIAAAEMAKQRQRGRMPGALQKYLDEILNPRVPWADVLSRWVGENGRKADYSYAKPSRRGQFVEGVLAGRKNHGHADICVLWDNSGSMFGREKEIFAEVASICQDLGLTVRVIVADTVIHLDFMLESVDDMPPIGGGGGSDFTTSFDKLVEDNFEGAVLAFTDGYIGVPETKPPLIQGVLWVIWDRDVDPTRGRWGEVLNVDAEGFKR